MPLSSTCRLVHCFAPFFYMFGHETSVPSKVLQNGVRHARKGQTEEIDKEERDQKDEQRTMKRREKMNGKSDDMMGLE
uniref:Uncharacterized protein n=1 Tax=Oryza brachyantha TaxID=4533 RepID=J3LX89_ORYBR